MTPHYPFQPGRSPRGTVAVYGAGAGRGIDANYRSRRLEEPFGAPAFGPRQRPRQAAGLDRSLGQVFAALWRHKLFILLSALLLGIIAYGIGATMTPRFIANGMLAVETRPLYMPQLGVQPQPWAPDIATPRTEVQVLQSRDLIHAVAQRLNLDQDPDLNPLLQEETLLGRGMRLVRTQMRNGLELLGVVPAETPAATALEDQVWASVVDNVRERLNVSTDGRSYAIYVGFESERPETAAAVVNTLMQAFIARQIETSNKTFMDANSWIKQRAEELRLDVEAVNKKIQDYRIKHGLVETRAGTVSSQQLSEINTQLSLARADLAQAEARYNQARVEAGRSGGPDTATSMEVLGSSLIARLREREAETAQREAEMSIRLGPSHPQRRAVARELSVLRGQINREIEKILVSLQNQVTIARTRVNTLAAQLEQFQSLATNVAGSEVELRQLEQEAETKRNVYQTFLATAQQTAEPSRINQANARIVSQAVPPIQPSAPRKGLMVIGGMLIGLLLSSGTVLLFSELNRGFESSDEIEESLGIPVLGALPLLRRMRARNKGLAESTIAHQRHGTAISETLRGIRVALGCRRGQGQGQVILVTSSDAGEGKTTFTSAMGAVAAQDGLRVLIVDSDLRRPRFHRLIRTEPGPALQDVLSGNNDWQSAVQTDPDSGAHCLTAEERTDSPVPLLNSTHWHAFLQQARKNYDLIILDSPPIIRVADALSLADHADAAIFVVSYRKTSRRMLQEALRRFATTHKPIAGIILTKVPTMRPAAPYYSGYGN